MCEEINDFEIHLKICENDSDLTTKMNMLPRYDVEEKTGMYFSHTYLSTRISNDSRQFNAFFYNFHFVLRNFPSCR